MIFSSVYEKYPDLSGYFRMLSVPEQYLISPDQALPNFVWAPPSRAEGGKSSKMRYRSGILQLQNIH